MVALRNWDNPPNAQRDKAVMRTFALAFLAACAPVLAQTNYGTITFTNKSGDVISNAVVTKVEAGKVTYRYSVGVGGGVVPLADLPEGLRAPFGDSPDRADNAAALQVLARPTEADRKKFKETKAKAETGEAQAQADLGHCYEKGDGVTKDVVEAVKWFRKAAEQGNASGERGLGFSYFTGNGVTKDAVEAVKWFRKASEKGDSYAQCGLGFCYDLGNGVTKDAVDAVKWYRKAAEQGNLTAETLLAYCYERGEGVTSDAVEAAKWYRKAEAQEPEAERKKSEAERRKFEAERKKFEETKVKAEKADPQAQADLGTCYGVGCGVTQDAVEAVKWYRKAAEQGFAKAQCDLGSCYKYGNGVTQDAVEAVKWFRKAAEQGVVEAQVDLALCYDIGDGVTKDAVEAVKWYQKAAEHGLAGAQYRLGLCYEYGDGVTKDAVEAVKWFRKAAAQGNPLAQSELKALGQEPANASASSNRPDLETLSLTTKVMESNDVFWRWSYQLKVRNNTDQPIHESRHLLFLETEGFIIEEETCQVKLSARETKTFLGTTLVDLPGAARVKTVKVQ